MSEPLPIRCADRLELHALPGVPRVAPGDDVGALVCDALVRAGATPETGRDVLVISSKIVSRAEDRFVDLGSVTPSPRAEDLAARVQKDPRIVELILQESAEVSRAAKGVLIVRHRIGFVSANAGIDESNGRRARHAGEGPFVLLLPRDPDASARAIRQRVRARFGADVGVVISDSHGRPFRVGTVGVAIGLSGLPAVHDQRGGRDLDGRVLEATITALADQVAAAADLVAGQADEGRPVVLVRGLSYPVQDGAGIADLLRARAQDLYA
jgi:coenzyme F420-0:L-glutamate ligase/coenzyme F420-1:gamma-L-glutamate ligase